MLRVLTGTAKGRQLKVPKAGNVRPTTGRVKQSVFDTLGDIRGLKVLDIFAGSGGLGIESLSRGAASATFIEKNYAVLKTLEQNITVCRFLDSAKLICADYSKALEELKESGEKFDLIFIDPPYSLYEQKDVYDLVGEASDLVKSYGVIIIEHDHDIEDDSPEEFTRIEKQFGGNRVSFFKKGE